MTPKERELANALTLALADAAAAKAELAQARAERDEWRAPNDYPENFHDVLVRCVMDLGCDGQQEFTGIGYVDGTRWYCGSHSGVQAKGWKEIPAWKEQP